MFVLSGLSEDQARQICRWKYEGEYSVYNFPDWETVKADGWIIADSESRALYYRAVLDGDRLCGFFHFIPGDDAVLLGLGLDPGYCGKGYGSELMTLIIGEFHRLYTCETLELEVRAFNRRALKCYCKAGFEIKGSYIKPTNSGEALFIRMRFADD